MCCSAPKRSGSKAARPTEELRVPTIERMPAPRPAPAKLQPEPEPQPESLEPPPLPRVRTPPRATAAEAAAAEAVIETLPDPYSGWFTPGCGFLRYLRLLLVHVALMYYLAKSRFLPDVTGEFPNSQPSSDAGEEVSSLVTDLWAWASSRLGIYIGTRTRSTTAAVVPTPNPNRAALSILTAAIHSQTGNSCCAGKAWSGRTSGHGHASRCVPTSSCASSGGFSEAIG